MSTEHARACAGCSGRCTPPSDLAALRASEGFDGTALDPALAPIAGFLPCFDRATAVTATSGSMLSESGRYGEPTFCGGALVFEPGRIAVRLHAPAVHTALISAPVLGRGVDAESVRMPPSIQLFDVAERSVHRAYVSVDDPLVLEALRMTCANGDVVSAGSTTGADSLVEPAPSLVEPPTSLVEPALSLVEPAETTPAASAPDDQLALFDAILLDGGRARHAALPSRGALAAHPVATWVVPDVLEYLAAHRLPVTLAVGTGGCVQLHRGPLDAVDRLGEILMARADSAALALDPGVIAEAWLTRSAGPFGPTAALELYSAAGDCLAVITQTGAVALQAHLDWEDIAASLPAA